MGKSQILIPTQGLDGRENFSADGAKERVRELGKLWPGEYVIENEETEERVVVSTRDETKN